MLVPVFRLPPRVVCLDHNHDGVHWGETSCRIPYGLPYLSGVVNPLVTHLTTVDTLVGTPLKETPPSAKQTICVSPSVDCLKPNNSRVISIKINTDQEDTFVRKRKIASSRLFTFFLSKKPFFCAPSKSMSDTSTVFFLNHNCHMQQRSVVTTSSCFKYLLL